MGGDGGAGELGALLCLVIQGDNSLSVPPPPLPPRRLATTTVGPIQSRSSASHDSGERGDDVMFPWWPPSVFPLRLELLALLHRVFNADSDDDVALFLALLLLFSIGASVLPPDEPRAGKGTGLTCTVGGAVTVDSSWGTQRQAHPRHSFGQLGAGCWVWGEGRA